jgi:hypothetical protein
VHSSGSNDAGPRHGLPRRALSVCLMDAATRRPDGSPLGASVLFGNASTTARPGVGANVTLTLEYCRHSDTCCIYDRWHRESHTG